MFFNYKAEGKGQVMTSFKKLALNWDILITSKDFLFVVFLNIVCHYRLQFEIIFRIKPEKNKITTVAGVFCPA